MKNLFLVINKEKIYAYVVSAMTIVIIFFMSGMINSEINESEEASANAVIELKKDSANNISSNEISEIGDAISTNISN